jgi:hypothetical protein
MATPAQKAAEKRKRTVKGSVISRRMQSKARRGGSRNRPAQSVTGRARPTGVPGPGGTQGKGRASRVSVFSLGDYLKTNTK